MLLILSNKLQHSLNLSPNVSSFKYALVSLVLLIEYHLELGEKPCPSF